MKICKITVLSILILVPVVLKSQPDLIRSEMDQNKTVNVHVDYKYILEVPKTSNPDTLFPLLIFLHGSGERGDSVDLVRVHGPWKFLESHPEYGFIILAPQCHSDDYWNPAALDLLVSEIIRKYPVDTMRIYLTGLSMGGYGTWDFAFYHPQRFAAIAPVCGSSIQFRLRSVTLKDMPIWIFHGALDDVVPIDNSVEVVKRLIELGNPVKFTVYPYANHDAWTKTYQNEELYKWFLEHQRQN